VRQSRPQTFLLEGTMFFGFEGSLTLMILLSAGGRPIVSYGYLGFTVPPEYVCTFVVPSEKNKKYDTCSGPHWSATEKKWYFWLDGKVSQYYTKSECDAAEKNYRAICKKFYSS
jgi:hypothetical protein